MAMYVERPSLLDEPSVDQGDLIAKFWRPMPAVGKNLYALKSDKKTFDFQEKEPFKRPVAYLRVECAVTVVDIMLVTSNSCDNARGGHTVSLVPVRPFPLDPSFPIEKQWRMISEAATGTATPKFFYLTGDPSLHLVRSEAVLSDPCNVAPDYIGRCAREGGTTRIGGLTPEALRHLQWAIGLVASRDPRDDYAWPSREDLEVKLASVESEIRRGSKDHDWLVEQRTKITQKLQARAEAVVPTAVRAGVSAAPPPRRSPTEPDRVDGVAATTGGGARPTSPTVSVRGVDAIVPTTDDRASLIDEPPAPLELGSLADEAPEPIATSEGQGSD